FGSGSKTVKFMRSSHSGPLAGDAAYQPPPISTLNGRKPILVSRLPNRSSGTVALSSLASQLIVVSVVAVRVHLSFVYETNGWMNIWLKSGRSTLLVSAIDHCWFSSRPMVHGALV